MMNKIWLSIIIMSLTLLIFTSPEKALPAMIDASTNAVNLSIKLLAIYALWLGIIEIVKVTKLGEKLSNLLSPLIDFLFGKIDNKAKEYISLNMSFNMLGVGNAATPTALKAIQRLNGNAEIATTASIMLLVLNATSLQIIPTTIIGMKTASLSANPTNIILPTLIASLLGTILAVILVKVCSKIYTKKMQKNQINPLNYYKKTDTINNKAKITSKANIDSYNIDNKIIKYNKNNRTNDQTLCIKRQDDSYTEVDKYKSVNSLSTQAILDTNDYKNNSENHKTINSFSGQVLNKTNIQALNNSLNENKTVRNKFLSFAGRLPFFNKNNSKVDEK